MSAAFVVHPVFLRLFDDTVVVLVNGEDDPYAVFVGNAGTGVGHIEFHFGVGPLRVVVSRHDVGEYRGSRLHRQLPGDSAGRVRVHVGQRDCIVLADLQARGTGIRV